MKTKAIKTIHTDTHFSFNLNMAILVKLNDIGYARLANMHNKYLEIIPNWEERSIQYYKNRADKEGYTNFQAWDFIQKFGDVTGIGFNTPYSSEILIKKSDCNEVLKLLK